MVVMIVVVLVVDLNGYFSFILLDYLVLLLLVFGENVYGFCSRIGLVW